MLAIRQQTQRLISLVVTAATLSLTWSNLVYAEAQIPASSPKTTPESTAPQASSLSAFKMLNAEQEKQSAVTRVSSLELLAQSKFQNAQYKECIATLKKAFAVYDASDKKDVEQHARLLMIYGDCFYENDKYKEAIEKYAAAYQELSQVKAPHAVVYDDCLNALAGSYIHEKQFDKATPIYEELVKHSETTSGSDSVQLLWAYLDLINCYKALKRENDMVKLRGLILQLLSANVSKQDLASGGRAKPAGFEEQRPLPLIVWRTKTEVPKAAIIAIHGLGMHCASFQKFAERMNAEGITIAAIDVRGFGSWKLARGREQLDLKRSIDDIAGLVGIAHMKMPNTPVFVLGESMGGALALRYAADYPDTVAGVISSVPADKRYEEKREALRVAFNFLKHRNKTMSVANVLSRAATKDSVSSDVDTDPFMRADLTPKELLQFQRFMTETAKKANQIKYCPVLMVQGMKDQLVKPGATINLYNNLKTADRDLYLVGECQHLIFEEVDTPDVVFQSVMVWLNNRIKIVAENKTANVLPDKGSALH